VHAKARRRSVARPPARGRARPAEAGREKPWPGVGQAASPVSMRERGPCRYDRGGGTVRWGALLGCCHPSFIAAFFSVHLMRNNNNDLKSNKRFNNFTNRLT